MTSDLDALRSSLVCVEQFLIEADFDAAVSVVKEARDRLYELQDENALLKSFGTNEASIRFMAILRQRDEALAQVSVLQAEVERLQKVEGERDATLSALKGLLREILPTSPAEPYMTPGWAAIERSVRTLADLDGRLASARTIKAKEGSDAP